MEDIKKNIELSVRRYSDVISAVIKEIERKMRICLVGGTVRDFILGEVDVCDFDFVVEGDVISVGRELFRKLRGKNLKYSEYFGTLSFEFQGGLRIDLARARKEIYPIPGKHPKVTFVDNIEQDLGRRDFTINSIAVEISGDIKKGDFSLKIIDPFGGIEDILKRKIRVLHRNSIADDPTRILRAVRFSKKLNLEIAQETIESLELAKKIGAFHNVQGDRFFSELKLGAYDTSFFDFILELDRLSVLFSIRPELPLSSEMKKKLEAVKNLDNADERIALFISIYYTRSFPDRFQKIVEYFKVSKKILKSAYNFIELEN